MLQRSDIRYEMHCIWSRQGLNRKKNLEIFLQNINVTGIIPLRPGIGPVSINNIAVDQTEFNDKDTTNIIAQRQFDVAWNLINEEQYNPIAGDIRFKQKFVNMATWTGQNKDGQHLNGMRFQ